MLFPPLCLIHASHLKFLFHELVVRKCTAFLSAQGLCQHPKTCSHPRACPHRFSEQVYSPVGDGTGSLVQYVGFTGSLAHAMSRWQEKSHWPLSARCIAGVSAAGAHCGWRGGRAGEDLRGPPGARQDPVPGAAPAAAASVSFLTGAAESQQLRGVHCVVQLSAS